MKAALLLLPAVLLTSCYTQRVYTDYPMDPNDKTMMIPSGAGVLLSGIKHEMRRNGWELYTRTIGSDTSYSGGTSKTRTASGARYDLDISYQQVDVELFTFDPMYTISCSVSDLKTGRENFSINCGKYTEKRFMDLFLKTIRDNTAGVKVKPQ